jgi:hypothetical protein
MKVDTNTKIKEDAVASGATNAAGSGSVEGIGVGPKGEPGVYPKKKLRSIVMTKTPLSRLKREQ